MLPGDHEADTAASSLSPRPSVLPPPPQSGKRSLIPFAVGLAIMLIAMEWLGVIELRQTALIPDFRNFYAAGAMVRSEPSRLFDLAEQKRVQDALVSPQPQPLPYIHPSAEALVYAPFALLPFPAAYLAAIACNVLLLAVILWVGWKTYSPAIASIQPFPGLMLLLFCPVWAAIWQGKDSLLFLLIVLAAWNRLRDHHDGQAGLVLACALFRFPLAIPIALLVTVFRGWSFARGFVLGAAAFAAVCLALTGWNGQLQYVRLLSMASLAGDSGEAMRRLMTIAPGAMPNLYGLLSTCGAQFLPARVASGLLAVVSLALLVFVAWRLRRCRDAAAGYAAAILVAILISQHLYIHDTSLLLLPVALLAGRVPHWTVLTGYYAPIALFLLGGPNWFFLGAIPTMLLLWYAMQSQPSRRAENVAEGASALSPA